MVPYKLLHQPINEFQKKEAFTPLHKLLLSAIRLGSATISFKLQFYHFLMSFIRVVALKILVQNHITKEFNTTSGTLQRLGDLLIHFNLASKVDGKIVITAKSAELKNIVQAAQNQNNAENLSSYWNKQLHQYFKVLELIDFYRDRQPLTSSLKQVPKWKQFLNAGVLDYEVRLAETLFELGKLEIGSKIPSPFSESYYSESGRNAFHNFTKARFIEALGHVHGASPAPQILDIGCGYGNYIDAALQWSPEASVVGYELQEDLFKEVKSRFKEYKKIHIYNEDILSAQPKEQFHIVLLNYVLFYFDQSEKQQLFKKIKECLAKDGSILVCQYYSGIEHLKYQLAKQQGEATLAGKIEMYYGNKVLYANALWNETASTFSEAEDWLKFNKILADNGLKIKRLTNADRFYYSLFIEIKHV